MRVVVPSVVLRVVSSVVSSVVSRLRIVRLVGLGGEDKGEGVAQMIPAQHRLSNHLCSVGRIPDIILGSI